ncbi:MAG: hypothetical protein KAI72_05025 [Candidatus Pacebacteria bacterium]|nr:hypothetical protein [Candidatus Paceibacterota bacterium]
MTKFDTPKKVLDEFHSYMGSGLSMDYHVNGMPQKMFIEELAQRDQHDQQEPKRDIYKRYLQALYLQKKLLCTSEDRIFTYTKGQRKILEEKGLIQVEKPKTHWWFVIGAIALGSLILLFGNGIL